MNGAATPGEPQAGRVDGVDEAAFDRALWQRYRAGDAAAFAQLHARHRLPLYRFLVRLLGSAATADDVYQEVWLQIIERADRFRSDGVFRTWLFTIARSRGLDRLRRDAVRTPSRAADPIDDAAAYSDTGAGETSAQDGSMRDDPTDAVVRAERERLLAAALATLPEAQREVFLLREEGELALPEAARVLGITYEAAKSRYRYAVTRLRRYFGLDGPVSP